MPDLDEDIIAQAAGHAWAKHAAMPTPAQPATPAAPAPPPAAPNTVVPKFPALQQPAATENAANAWLHNNYSGNRGFGQNRQNFYTSVRNHLWQNDTPAVAQPGAEPTNSVQRYTGILDKRFQDQVQRVQKQTPFQLVENPNDKLLHANVAPGTTPTLNLPNNPKQQYAGQNNWMGTRYEGDKNYVQDAYSWGRAQPRSLIGLHELEHVQQAPPSLEDINSAGMKITPMSGTLAPHPATNFYEPAAVMGEFVNSADAARTATGTPVQDRVSLAPGYEPKIDWLRQQAQQHGYAPLGGDKNMTQLLNTPAGQAWLRMQNQRYADAGNPRDYALTAPPAQQDPTANMSMAELQNHITKTTGIAFPQNNTGLTIDGQPIPDDGRMDPRIGQGPINAFMRGESWGGLGPGRSGWSWHPYDIGPAQPETGSRDNFLQSMLKGTYDRSKKYRFDHGIAGEALPGQDAQFYYNNTQPFQKQNSAKDIIAQAAGRAWAKQADLVPGIQLQEHQQRISDRVTGENPRMLVYHGLGSGKSLSALAAAEAAQRQYGGNYGIVAPASLKGNFQKEIKKFTTSHPEVMSYTGLGMGKQFKDQPETLVMDEAARLRNPNSAMTRAAFQAAQKADRLMLLTGTPITNEPKDLASIVSMLNKQNITPEQFEKEYVGYKKVWPGLWGWLHGAKAGMKPIIRNGPKLRSLLEGKVDYQPSKTPEGVNINEQTVYVPLSAEQQKIQKAVRTKVPPGFLWKMDKEFPLSRQELAKLNSFLTGLRQVSLSTQPFRADRDPLKAFQQSAKMQEAFKNLKGTLDSDPRKKAIIYSNFVDAGLAPYAAGLTQAGVPHAFFHGGVSPKVRQAAVDAYNAGKLRALLIGPAGAEGISTKGTSLIQLMDPHWNEARTQQARGRGLRFDSHMGLPEELKNVAVQRYISRSEDPSLLGKLMGYKRERTGDEMLERLTAEKEKLNEEFRNLLREIGSQHKQNPAQLAEKVSFSFACRE